MSNIAFNIIFCFLICATIITGVLLFKCKNEALLLEKNIFFLKNKCQKIIERIKLLEIEEAILLNPIKMKKLAKNINWQMDCPVNAISYKNFSKKYGE